MRLRALAVVATTSVALLGAGAGIAHAQTSGNGVCEEGEICLYWDGNQQGSVYDDTDWEWDLAGKRFVGPGGGQGQLVKNNAASARNNTGCNLGVYVDEGYSGKVDVIPPHSARNLYWTWNNEASYTASC